MRIMVGDVIALRIWCASACDLGQTVLSIYALVVETYLYALSCDIHVYSTWHVLVNANGKLVTGIIGSTIDFDFFP